MDRSLVVLRAVRDNQEIFLDDIQDVVKHCVDDGWMKWNGERYELTPEGRYKLSQATLRPCVCGHKKECTETNCRNPIARAKAS